MFFPNDYIITAFEYMSIIQHEKGRNASPKMMKIDMNDEVQLADPYGTTTKIFFPITRMM